MARSVNTIFNSILAAKEANADLAVINTSSKTSIYRLWAWITATAMFTVETFFDLLPAELKGILASQKSARLLWYRWIAMQFQFGDALQVSDYGAVSYSNIDTTKQIIKQCNAVESGDGIILKIATIDTNNALCPLSTEQLNAFSVYIAKVKIAGTHVFIRNRQADKIKIAGIVYFNPLIMRPDGTLISDNSRPVDNVSTDFLRNLLFDGLLRRTDIISTVKTATGVVDFKLIDLQCCTNDSGEYNEIDVSYLPESGYFKIDDLFPLATTITYQSDVSY